MSTYTPKLSQSKFIATLNQCHTPKANRCHLCHGELNSPIPLDPPYICNGPAIKLPCCNLLLGKQCLLQYMKQRDNPICISCHKPWYHKTTPARIHPWRKRWQNLVVGVSCILYAITLVVNVISIDDDDDEIPLSMSRILGTLWNALRPGLEVILVFLLCAPIDEDLQRRLLRRGEGAIFRVVEGYIELPPILSVPLMVFLQGIILWQLGRSVLGG